MRQNILRKKISSAFPISKSIPHSRFPIPHSPPILGIERNAFFEKLKSLFLCVLPHYLLSRHHSPFPKAFPIPQSHSPFPKPIPQNIPHPPKRPPKPSPILKLITQTHSPFPKAIPRSPNPSPIPQTHSSNSFPIPIYT